ncbi:MAG: alpha-hydroxy acid oxidase [Alphaproteobacteria bacterium]|jgi:L-lactate dehydrogenase (cytochrome)/(S)-mandelate dehydrogenase|nr:alpha-hydroxy acid oxidase [Alphaproteobacteria bacterium]
MKTSDAINIEDLRQLAKRRLPKIAFDFIEGGVEDEDGLDRNEELFRKHRLVPRYLVDITERDQTTTLFGRDYASPIGISPTGIASLFRPGADLMLAEAARDANIPFVMSGASTASIEELAKLAPEHGWYQLYAARDKSISDDMIRRADDAGLSTLAFTVDVPVHTKRERNMRNGFARPLKLSLSTRLDALRHPAWLAGYLKSGTPMFSNWIPYVGNGASADEVADFVSKQTPAPMSWADVERFRRLWPRNFVIKGIMHPDDAVRAAELGVDGIVVSNHGARQLDRAPSPLEVLPAIRDAVGDRMTVMLDSGVRRGADALVALCLGAEFVFVGRPTLYGTVTGGLAGAAKALDILRDEIDLNMAQAGLADLKSIGPDHLLWEDPDDLRRNRWPGAPAT